MKIDFKALRIQSLLLLAGLAVCACVMADEAEVVIQPLTEESASNKQAAQATKNSLKNPNALLVAMAFKFKKIEGSPSDYAEVAATYCRAARSGDADAQYALGWMYANGRGVVADEKIAVQLFSMAAEQGHALAQESLAQESLAKIADQSQQPPLLACLLPDSPAPVAVTPSNEVSQSEQKTISDKTAALFYSQGHILKLVNKLAPRYEIDTNLVMTFIAVESGFNVKATSPKNAQGLMQLIPETAKRFGVKDAYKAEDNIKGGMAYLQWLLAYFKGDVQLVAAAYNAGERAVEKYKGVPPYSETQLYVKKIAKLYNSTTHPYSNHLDKTSPILNLPNSRTM